MALFPCNVGSGGGSDPLPSNMYAYSAYSGNYGQGTITLNQAITLQNPTNMCGVFNIAELGATTMHITVSGMYLSAITIADGVITPISRYVSNATDITVTGQDLVVIGGRHDTNDNMTVTFT